MVQSASTLIAPVQIEKKSLTKGGINYAFPTSAFTIPLIKVPIATF